MVLADTITTAQNFVQTLFYVYLALVLAYIITSWIPLPYSVWLNRIQRFLYDVVDPYLRLFRRFLPALRLGGAGLDLSPIVAIIVLYVLNTVIQEGLELLR
ncbi:MAG TPA: YggT family protein [Gaiellaceae bacterium]|nr:YggT family protein [Gaiellaceae bacterium]